MISGKEPEIVEIADTRPASEALLHEAAEAMAEQAVIARPKRGLGLAALFSRKKHHGVELETDESGVEDEDSEDEVGQESGCFGIEMPKHEVATHREDYDGPGFATAEPTPPHKNGQLNSVIECILFVSDGPITVKHLAETLEIEDARVEEAIGVLEEHLRARGGLQLMKVAGGYQLCTRPEYADYCAMVLQPAKRRLSKAALETLAVVAYRQPCTMPEIEAVRGVSVDGVMRTLMERGLAKEAGRKQTPGRPLLYVTTPEFLEYFGLNDLSELPDIDMLAVEEVKALQAQRELFVEENAEERDNGED
jgi:segregation and condensation protein B